MADTLDLLIIGGSGFIGGRAAQAALAAGLRVGCTHLQRPIPPGAAGWKLDVLDPAALRECLAAARPRAVIYCALSWDLASLEAQMRLSRDGLLAVIAALRACRLGPRLLPGPWMEPGTRLVYVSTNAVFSGLPGAHREGEPPDPENRADGYRNYGLARRAGEVAALEGWENSLVVRTANVDGRDWQGALNPRLTALLAPLRAGQPLPRFVDRVISPTLVDSVAAALVEAAAPEFPLPPGRVLHAAGREPASDYQYARRLAHAIGADPALVREDHYQRPPGVPGPYDISLNTAFTESVLRTKMLNLDEMVGRLLG